jgi:hypothetical protein
LSLVPKPIGAQDFLELSVANHLSERGIDRSFELRLGLLHADHVNPTLHVAGKTAKLGERTAVEIGDDVVEQHRLHAFVHEVEVRLLLTLVEHELDRTLREKVVSDRVVQRRNAFPAQVVERAVRGALAHGERFAEHEVGNAEEHPFPSRGSILDAVERDVEVAALERRDEVRPIVLHEAGFDAEPAGEGRRDVDFEPPKIALVVLIDVRRSPLQVAAPPELSAARELTRDFGVGARCVAENHERNHEESPTHVAPERIKLSIGSKCVPVRVYTGFGCRSVSPSRSSSLSSERLPALRRP